MWCLPQLALQLHQERTQVVCNNRKAWKRPAKSNCTPAIDLGHMNAVLKWCICMPLEIIIDLPIGFPINNIISLLVLDLGIVIMCIIYYHYYVDVFCFVCR